MYSQSLGIQNHPLLPVSPPMSREQSSCCAMLPEIRNSTDLFQGSQSSSFLSFWSEQSEDEEYKTLEERFWRRKSDNTKKIVTAPLCALEIPRELAMLRTLAFTYRQRSLHGLHVCLWWSSLQRTQTSEKKLCCHKGRSCCVSHRQALLLKFLREPSGDFNICGSVHHVL